MNALSEAELLLPYETKVLRGDYREYLKVKRRNSVATVQAFPRLWEAFQLLDEIWKRGFDDLEQIREVEQMFPLIVFMHAHSQFRIALELGFSCCIGEAWNVLRSGIESVVHGHKVYREPHLLKVWLEKDVSREQKRAFSKAFRKDKTLFPSEYGLDKLHVYWSQYSEFGTHTTLSALGRRFTESKTPTHVSWKLHYFEIEPDRIELFLFSLVTCSRLMEKAFFDCFDTRLRLDPELAEMRHQFEADWNRYWDDLLKRGILKPPDIMC